jgi:hypothetical protein
MAESAGEFHGREPSWISSSAGMLLSFEGSKEQQGLHSACGEEHSSCRGARARAPPRPRQGRTSVVLPNERLEARRSTSLMTHTNDTWQGVFNGGRVMNVPQFESPLGSVLFMDMEVYKQTRRGSWLLTIAWTNQVRRFLISS